MRLFGVLHHLYLYLSHFIADDVTVYPPAGPIIGTVIRSVTGRDVFAFRGIPYGKAPTGDLRFEPPEPLEAWDLAHDGRKDHPGCLRVGFYPWQGVQGTEDCLILNVYTPLRPNARGVVDGKLPILVYIHGGSFTIGESDSFTYNPGFFMEYPMVMVTIGYRLGAFGFLSTEDTHYPGNMGLLDQILALKWIQKNIRSFGGDPDRVTLMGESAGGAAVHMLMVSPLTKGLFHRAISQSGTAFSPAMKYSYGVGRRTIQLAEKFNCDTTNSRALVDCLRQQDGAQIVAHTTNLPEWGLFPFSFTPRVDRESNSPVIPDEPTSLYQMGQVANIPWLCGQNVNEGEFWAVQKKVPFDELSRASKKDFNRIVSLIVGTHGTNQSVNYCSIRDNYYKPGVTSQDAFSELITDAYFLPATDYGEQWHSMVADTYTYVFSFRGKYSITGVLNVFSNFTGVAHADELQYLFGPNYLIVPYYKGTREYQMMKMMTKAWFEFVKTGKPEMKGVDEWPLFDIHHKKYVNITITPSIGQLYKEKQAGIWENLIGFPPVS